MNTPITLRIKRLDHANDLPLPTYATPDAAGFDLRSASQEPIVLTPGQRGLVPTGLVLEIPRGYEGQVRPRSGLALKNGISLVNTPGTIDSDYRGEVKVIMINLGEDHFMVNYGDRIAQLVIAPVIQAQIQEAGELSDTERGVGGFGSTGL
jgi:dUTP pyrophosphatase